MTKIQIRSTFLAALTMLAFAAVAAAQDKSSNVLNAVDVRQLVASSSPADHARLSTHFAALADRYAAEARRHTSMSQSAVGSPSRNITMGPTLHCKREAALNRQSAITVRELATYHQALASGGTATPPADGARFEAGAGAAAPNNQDIAAVAATASTPADHRNLEAYFLALAKRYTSDAEEHAAMARAYKGLTKDQAGTAAAHCERLVTLSKDSAKVAGEAAVMHQQLAGAAR